MIRIRSPALKSIQESVKRPRTLRASAKNALAGAGIWVWVFRFPEERRLGFAGVVIKLLVQFLVRLGVKKLGHVGVGLLVLAAHVFEKGADHVHEFVD